MGGEDEVGGIVIDFNRDFAELAEKERCRLGVEAG
jgi:hypothetical protein